MSDPVIIMVAPNGGHARIGFENNLYRADGRLAASTSELVAELKLSIHDSQLSVATPEQARKIPGIRIDRK
ncbi:MAG: 3-keto-5-aminohexanoate cleavage protein [Gammaproteobacteria bacterium]|nr:3-keto-5-aminohexanoate cleavage protein [Gammaproteobacteria bacterium]